MRIYLARILLAENEDISGTDLARAIDHTDEYDFILMSMILVG